jgi:hypothetical protein
MNLEKAVKHGDTLIPAKKQELIEPASARVRKRRLLLMVFLLWWFEWWPGKHHVPCL